MNTRRVVAALLLASAATVARAESPRWGSFSLNVGRYRPDLDSEEGLASPGPFQKVFGGGMGWTFGAGAAYALLTGVGSLEVGLQAGYFQRSGKGQFLSGGNSEDETKLRVVPTSATLTYRFDWLADRYHVPLAPYGRAAFERYNWWVTDGDNSTAKQGATNGWSVTAGVALLLDVFDPVLAREFDADNGINHTYLFVEAQRSFIDDFGSSGSWILSTDGFAYSGGLLFVF